MQNRGEIRTTKQEWQNWLKTVNNFFSNSSLASVLFKPNNSDVRPYIKVSVSEVLFYGLLDSGAAISVLGNGSHEYFINMGFSVNSVNNKNRIIVANGSESDTIGYLYLPVCYNNVTHVIKFFIIPTIVSDVLFGVDFWRAFNLAPSIFQELSCIEAPKSFICGASDSDSQLGKIETFGSLSESQKVLARQVVNNFVNISFDKVGLGRTSLIEHTIETGDSPPIKCRPYPMSPEKLQQLYKELDYMLDLGVVAPSEGPWNNPTLMVPKPDGQLRFCLDCRKLNSVTKGDAYAIPYIPQILDSLKQARYLSSIDLKASFWQIPLHPSSQEKTNFTVPGRGLFKFTVMPFGLCGAPARQQRLMDMLFGSQFNADLTNGICFVYVDDLIVASSDFETHLKILNRVFDKLKSANLTVNIDKCKFFRKSIKYLGYVVDEFGLRTDPDKIECILNFPTPSTTKEVKMFLGTCSWYRRFIRNFSTIAAPLNSLTSKKNKFVWTTEAEQAFKTLKSALVTAPILACPDFTLPFTVHCDASGYGIGGMLTQNFDGVDHPIAYISRSLNKCERNYSATEREALAVVYSVEKFEPYLGSRPFKIVTDHASLKWFMKLENPTGRLARWGCRLSQFDFEIVHRKGKDNIIPDTLSRLVNVDTVNNVSDEWYDRIYNSCTNSPNNFPNFRVETGVLLRFSKSKYCLTNEFDWKEVVHKGNRETIIAENHCPPTSGHLGIFKTHRRISLRYYWPGMFKDVTEYINKCETCISYKHSNRLTPGTMGEPKRCYRPFQVVSADLVGPLPKSRSGFMHLLVITCCFSKYSILVPLRRATSAAVAEATERYLFLLHGIPETVIADNGVQFTGSEFRALLNKYHVPRVHFGPRYTPQVNLVERYNKTIMTAVASYVKDDHRAWDVNIYRVQFAVNSSINESTGFSPFFLVHGREPVVDGTFYRKFSDSEYETDMPRDEYAGDLGTLKNVFEKVRFNLLKAHEHNKKHYDLRRRPAPLFNVGQIVYKRSYTLSDAANYRAAKLAPKYEKCRVKRVVSPLVLELESFDGRSLGLWHVKDVKV